MASLIYNAFKKNIMNGGIDLDTNTIKVALVTDGYTPDIDTDEDMADISSEVEGDGYSAGGATLGSVTVTVDTDNDRAVLDAADVTWSEASVTARGAVIYKSTGTAANDLLIAYIDFGADKTSSNDTFKITWSDSGILYLG